MKALAAKGAPYDYMHIRAGRRFSLTMTWPTVLADRLRTRLILTTDRRHFGVVRNAAGQPFQLLPDL